MVRRAITAEPHQTRFKLIVESTFIGRASPVPLLLALGRLALRRYSINNGSGRRLTCFNSSTRQQIIMQTRLVHRSSANDNAIILQQETNFCFLLLWGPTYREACYYVRRACLERQVSSLLFQKVRTTNRARIRIWTVPWHRASHVRLRL